MTWIDPAPLLEVQTTEILVIGGGAAGLSAVINAHPHSCTLVCKGAFGEDGSSPLAQGGIAVALGKGDSPEQHAADTLRAGCGLSDVSLALEVAREGIDRIAELIRQGASFDRDASGELVLGREAAHSKNRILHARGDRTGAEVVRTLKALVAESHRVRILEHTMVLRLIRSDARVSGAVLVDKQGNRRVLRTQHVVLATGGVGGLFRNTTNPVGMRGDGIALAAGVNARLGDLEFVQFHPTALADGSDPMVLVTEAMRGEGALLVDADGHRLMEGIHPDLELAPRDVVARRIWRVADSGRQAYLDARHLSRRIETRFPTVWELCLERGIDPTSEPIPVAAAAHYHMGGVEVDSNGQSTVPGLWACGEVACTGLHGANRLASNSLLEALVFGARVGEAISRSRQSADAKVTDEQLIEAAREICLASSPWIESSPELQVLSRAVRDAMWKHVGLERDNGGLQEMIAVLGSMGVGEKVRGVSELTLMLETARLITRSAIERKESIGAHFRRDDSEAREGIVSIHRESAETPAPSRSVASG